MGEVVDRLKMLDWHELGVSLALIHGSVLWSSRPRDVDLVVFVRRGFDEDDVAIKVMEAVEITTGLEADVYVISDAASANCFLLLEALRRGVIVYQEPDGRSMLVKAINICNDFMLSRLKLKYTETLLERVLK